MNFAGICLRICLSTVLLVAVSLPAQQLKQISAGKAFDAWATQTDPSSGIAARVALVDVRSKSEYFWIGAAAKTDKIILKSGAQIVPDHGKTILKYSNGSLYFKKNGHYHSLPLKKIATIETSPISMLIPYKKWNEELQSFILNDQFKPSMEALAADYDVIILFCRSGGRSGECTGSFNSELFQGVYEIDSPENNENGGFEGNNFSDIYNGYRGYPGRTLFNCPNPSVSWKDEGLPIHIGWK